MALYHKADDLCTIYGLHRLHKFKIVSWCVSVSGVSINPKFFY